MQVLVTIFATINVSNFKAIESKKESQLEILKDSFRADPNPRKEARDQLAESLNISEKQIVKWFRNRRYRKSIEGVKKSSE